MEIIEKNIWMYSFMSEGSFYHKDHTLYWIEMVDILITVLTFD